MTIDEEISHVKEVAAIQRNNEKLNRTLGSASPYINETCLECAEEHEQLAEWLEELKFIRQWKSDVMDEFCKYDCNSVEEAWHYGYNKAIDDFIKFANTMPTVETDDGEIRPMWLEEMAEQLKAGGNIELSEHSKSQGNRTGK